MRVPQINIQISMFTEMQYDCTTSEYNNLVGACLCVRKKTSGSSFLGIQIEVYKHSRQHENCIVRSLCRY